MKGSIVRLILWTCVGIIGAAILLEFFIPRDPAVPTLSDELLLQSQALRIQLEGETGRGWQKAVALANHGDAADLREKISEAIFDNNFQVAVVAVNLLNDGKMRDRLFDEIGNHAVEECSNLAYAAYAADNISQPELKRKLTERLNAREAICRAAKSRN